MRRKIVAPQLSTVDSKRQAEDARDKARAKIREWVENGTIGSVDGWSGDAVDGWYSVLGL